MARLLCWLVLASLILPPSAAQAQGRPADPHRTQIFSGSALNDLLTKCAAVSPLPELPEPPAKLPERARKAINILTPGGVDARVFFKTTNDKWPAALEEAAKEKKLLLAQLSATVKEARKGKVSAKTAAALKDAVKNLQENLQESVADMTPYQYIEAKRYTNRLKEGVKAADRPGLGTELALAEKALAEGKTAPDLVRFMIAKKLKFAPAGYANSDGYLDLHKALTDYHRKVGAARGK
jgi:hypothetical protein